MITRPALVFGYTFATLSPQRANSRQIMIMGWTLLAPATERSGPKTFQLPYDSPRSLVLTQLGGYKSLGIVGQLLPEVHTEVGQISTHHHALIEYLY